MEMIVERYELYYKEHLIGKLEVDTQSGKHRYTAACPLTEQLAKKYPFPPHLLHDSDGWVEPMGFFLVRIRDMKRWNLTEINYQTDYFLLKKI